MEEKVRSLPKLDHNLKILYDITVSCEADCSILSMIKNKKFQSSLLEEGLDYISILSLENYITKLSYEEAEQKIHEKERGRCC